MKKIKSGLETCPECGSSEFMEDPSRAELICAKCGLVLKEEIIDTTQEWRAFDSEQMARRARGGAPLAFSVDYEEPIVIKEGDEVKIVKIGEFVDKIMEENKEKIVKRDIFETVSIPEGKKFFAVGFDKDYNVGFYPITEVTRHVADFLFELEVEGGKKVKLTGSHSIYTVVDNVVRESRVDSLKVGDFVVAPKRIPSSSKFSLTLDLIEEFSKLSYPGIYLRHISDLQLFKELSERSKEFGISTKQIRRWEKRKILPLPIFKKLSFNYRLNGEKIGIRSGASEIPTSLNITEDLCKLLGFYVAEGSSRNSVIFSFGSHETNYINEVKSILKSTFDLNVREEKLGSVTRIVVSSKPLALLFSKILKAGEVAKEKRVPPIIFSLPERMKRAFIHGYISGDGHVWRRENSRDTQVGISTANEDLVNDLLFLYLQLGVYANYVKAKIPFHQIEKTGQILPDTITNMVRITNPDVASELGFTGNLPHRKRKGVIEDLIPAPVKYRKEWKFRKRIRINKSLAISIARKYNDKDLLKLAQAPFMFLRVKNIRKVKSTNGYAYDLTVPGCENFAGKLFYVDTKHDKGLTTEIGKGLGELYKVPPKKRAQYYRLTKWHRRFIKARDRNISFAFSELQRMVSYLNIPKPIHERVARYYEECVDRGLVRGRSIEAIVAALIYGVSREFGSPRTIDEIAEASGVDKKDIGKTYRYIARELNIRILPARPEDYIPRFCSLLGLSDRVAAKATSILKKAREKDVISGKGPTGVAAAAIYIGSVLAGEKRTQREIADLCNITEVTIRCRYREIVEKLGIEEEVERKAAEE